MKFKKGDYVKIREDLVGEDSYISGPMFNHTMVKFLGDIMKIIEKGSYGYRMETDPIGWSWTDRMIKRKATKKEIEIFEQKLIEGEI